MEKIERVRWAYALIWMPILLLVTPLFANTQQNTRRSIWATWVENPPVIDGDLTDKVWQNDCIEVMLDIYHDQRNCYIFAINTLGTQTDERVGNESTFDMLFETLVSEFDAGHLSIANLSGCELMACLMDSF